MNLFDAVAEYDDLDSVNLWPHQELAVSEFFRLVYGGARRILIQSPTGGGKSVVIFKIVTRFMEEFGEGVILFCNRKLLVEQMLKGLAKYNISAGVRSARHDFSPMENFQVASIQSEHSRVMKRGTWQPHRAKLLVVDEAHLNENPTAAAIYKRYADGFGAVKLGLTATPLGIAKGYDELVQAGTTSELRDCGALVPAVHFGCTEPDMKNIRRYQIGEDISEPDNVKAIMAPGIHGKVIQWFRRLNPQGLPSIGFGPGVPESLGFAEAFVAAGIPAAHIDGGRIWANGDWLESTEDSRAALLNLSKTGQVRIVWNRFVLREAVDMPWLRHGIFATVFGSLQSYLQSGGRLLRACPPVGKESVSVQDHGGNWWRHGSLNADRVWGLTDTDRVVAQLRRDAITGDDEGDKQAPEPFLCKECNQVLVLRNIMHNFMARCPRCGHEMDFRRRSRPVIQASGELVEHAGPIFQRRRTELRKDTQAKWRDYYFRAKNSKMTFAQAAGLFFHENGYYPPRTLEFMPVLPIDWYRPVRSIPANRLRAKPKDENDAP